MNATWTVTVMLWALLFTLGIFNPYLSARHFSKRVDKVVRPWIVELVSVKSKLTTLVNCDSCKRQVLGLLPNEPCEDTSNPLNKDVFLLKPTIPPP